MVRARPLVLLAAVVVALSGTPAAAAGQVATTVRINEVESSGGLFGDWVELVNTGFSTADVSGWVLRDNDNSHTYTFAANSLIAPGGYRVALVESAYGLGAPDAARLYQPDGVTLVDSYSWSSHAATTYGRCADGVGAFVTTTASTMNAANACPVPHTAWPGGSTVTTADGVDVLGSNMSGLSFQGADVLWAVRNSPGQLYRLVHSGLNWNPDSTGGWSAGKTLRYANGTGDPDAEGVVATPDGLVVATERNNADDDHSLLKVLRYDPASTATTLNATAEWNLTADLPKSGDNSGLEAISWLPDSYLTAHGFRDGRTGGLYDPATYPGHGTGLYVVGLESTGGLYVYALDQNGTGYTRIATAGSGFSTVMELEFEPATGHLWAVCDDSCHGQSTILDIDALGHLGVTALRDRPAGMPDYNNEGFAIAPPGTCSGGRTSVMWSNDSNTGSHALFTGTLNCT
jgi:hypothetical protein